LSSQTPFSPQLPEIFSRMGELLRAHNPSTYELPGFTPAAVVLLLWVARGQPHLLLIRRSRSLRHHPGEIGFPGGRKDPSDPDLRATAIRELHEEVGVRARHTMILGRLEQQISFSRYCIAPFVLALSSPPVLRPNGEVQELLPMSLARLPLEGFIPENREFLGKTLHSWRLITEHGPIWGATARILRGFLLLLAQHGLLPQDRASAPSRLKL